ncbi:M13 family metallopeptidase [Acidicapsa dinghuensis]|uniref:M13 family metallopeptidase n=1 Tax=Acidicapsa dinghuensis TaxID=2218256 RepID=A0ABW1ENH3_9BACT|nr:M13 family metallopeptidase [Acidicapsa dinghuensis]
MRKNWSFPVVLFVVMAVATVVPQGLTAQSVSPAEAAHPLTSMPYSPSLDLTSMDRSVDPCQDFYKFVCGGWQKNNPIPSDEASWSVYGKLANENQEFLWGILQNDSLATNRTPVQQKIGDYFGACMDTAAIDQRGSEPLQAMLRQVDALNSREALLQAIASIHHEFSGGTFFNAGTGQDAMDASLVIVELGAGGLGLPDRDYYVKTDAKSQTLLKQYQDYVAQILTMAGEPQEQAKTDAASIVRIETALAKAQLTRVERRDPHKIYHKMTVSELQTLAPAIHWEAYFAEQGAPGLKTLNVSQPEFIKEVNAELTAESLADLKAYLRFHLASAAAPYLATPFRDAQFDFYSKTLRGIPVEPPRWKQCTRQVDRFMGEALGQEFVRLTFSADMKAKTRLMTEQIETAMKQEIEGLDWMSPETKQEALRKLHAIRNKIGYPDRWRDYSALTVKSDDYFGDTLRAMQFETARRWNKLGKPVDLNEWGMSPPTVNAYFNPQMNDINFPAGVLQPPLYDPKMDDAPNYGNTGATIGHELTHAFDDEGRQFDAKGNLKDWWTPADAKGFEDRINCVRDQYAQYVIVDDIHINSKLTSGEDVADLGGTLLAYIAWKMQTATETLTPRDGFTPDQRFFIGMGQWACENVRPEDLRVNALTDPHSPGFARINGVVSNMPQFQKAFGCKAGQPMVHEHECKVW